MCANRRCVIALKGNDEFSNVAGDLARVLSGREQCAPGNEEVQIVHGEHECMTAVAGGYSTNCCQRPRLVPGGWLTPGRAVVVCV